jgi:hypothetical protein
MLGITKVAFYYKPIIFEIFDSHRIISFKYLIKKENKF